MFDGIGKGVKGFGISLFDGVTGIITQPIKGAKKDGFSGFGKGIVKGVTGVAVKPISGVIDIVSKTTAGIESAVEGPICEHNNQKYRQPRAFYRRNLYFTEFDALHAAAYHLLMDTSNDSNYYFANSNDYFFGAFKLGLSIADNDVVEGAPVLMVTMFSLVVFDANLNLDWMRAIADLSDADGGENPSVTPQSNNTIQLVFNRHL